MTDRRQEDLEAARSAIARVERAVLGALIMGDAGVRELGLEVDDFYEPRHGALLGLLLAMEQRGEPIDLATVAVAVARGQSARFGGVAYVAELPEDVVATTYVAHYAKLVREAAARRHAVAALRAAIERIQNGELVDDVLRSLPRPDDRAAA